MNCAQKTVFRVLIRFHLAVSFCLFMAAFHAGEARETFKGIARNALTDEERAYLQQNPVATIAMTNDWYPFSFQNNGILEGFNVDLAHLIEKKTGLAFELKPDTWANALSAFKDGKVDIIDGISYQSDREAFTLFTEPYYEIPIVIICRNDFGAYYGLSSLKGKRIGIVKDIYYTPQVKKIDGIDIVEYLTTAAQIKALAFGDIDAAINNYANCQQIIIQNAYAGLTVLSELKMSGVQKEDLRLGVRKDLPILHGIVQKGLAALTRQELSALKNKWMSPQGIRKQHRLNLTAEEQAFLKRKKTLRFCVDPFWPPFEYLDQKGELQGIMKDYYRLFADILEVELELFPTDSWQQTLVSARGRQCDFVGQIAPTNDRKTYLDFTEPYLDFPQVIATKADKPFIADINNLMDKPFGAVAGYAIIDILKQKYPEMKIHPYPSVDHGFIALTNGNIYGFIDFMPSIVHAIQKIGYTDLKVSGKLEEKVLLSVGTRNDEPLLGSIFQKVIQSIEPNDHRNIMNRWTAVKVQEQIDYTLLWKIFIGVTLVLTAGLFWINRLNTLNRKIRLANRKAEAATRAKSEFLANMSHEIRTPINAIIGFAELALQTQMTPTQIDYLNKIGFSAKSLVCIINDILDFSKIEAGKLSLEKTRFNPREVLTNAIDLIRLKAEKKGVLFRFDIEASVPRYLFGDPLRLTQVVLNLVDNAVKFTKKGHVVITIRNQNRGETAATGKTTLLFSIEDTGIGLRGSQMDKLFDSFSQADTSTTRKYGGTGLGLSISKNLIEMMGGTITVKSEKGKGSVFTFTAVFDLASPYEKMEGASRDEASLGMQGIETVAGAKILLVEDNETNQMLTIETLRKKGINVTAANNGKEAVAIIRSDARWDAVLMDIQMPVMDGYEATRLIRQDNRFKKLPIIAMTAHVADEYRQQCFDAGMNAYIPKPVDAIELYATLLQWIHPAEADNLHIPTPGLNTEKGLNIVGGSEKAYYRILNKFYECHYQASHKIEDAIKNKEIETAAMLAHSIKGVAGSIGAVDLQEISAELETALNNNETAAAAELLIDFSSAMKLVLTSIAGLLGYETEN